MTSFDYGDTSPDLWGYEYARLMFRGVDLAPELKKYVATVAESLTTCGILPPLRGFGLAATPILPRGSLKNADQNGSDVVQFAVAVGSAGESCALSATRALRDLVRMHILLRCPPATSLELLRCYRSLALDEVGPPGVAVQDSLPLAGAAHYTNGVDEGIVSLSLRPEHGAKSPTWGEHSMMALSLAGYLSARVDNQAAGR